MSEIKNFIMIFKRSFHNNENLLSPQQLFIYAFLFRNRQQFENEWVTNISVNSIYHQIKCKIDGANTKKRISITSDLLSLRDKGYLMFTEIQQGQIKKDENLSITFSVNNEEETFITIPYSIFDKFNSREKFWLYTYFSYNTFRGCGVDKSQKELSEMLGISKSKLIYTIDSMNREDSDPRIYKFSGSYVNGSKIQEENEYFSSLSEERLTEYNRLYDENGAPRHKRSKSKLRSDDEIIDTSYYGQLTVREMRKCIKESKWQKGVPLTYEDYAIYKISVDENIDTIFNSRCKKGIETLKSYASDRYDFEYWENVYLGKCELTEKKGLEAYINPGNFDDYEGVNPFD